MSNYLIYSVVSLKSFNMSFKMYWKVGDLLKMFQYNVLLGAFFIGSLFNVQYVTNIQC